LPVFYRLKFLLLYIRLLRTRGNVFEFDPVTGSEL